MRPFIFPSLLLGFSLLGPLSSPLNAATADTGTITAVTVYVRGALLTREIKTELVAGENKIEIEGLPTSLLPETLQVEGAGAMKTEILDIGVSTQILRETRQEKLRALEEQLVALKDKEADLLAQEEILETTKAYLQNIRSFETRTPEEGTLDSVSSETWLARIKFQESELERVLNALLALKKEKRELKKDIDQAAGEIMQLRQTSDTRSQTVSVKLNAAAAGDYVLKLKYLIHEAGWVPDYLIHGSEHEDTLKLTLRGTLTQRSGEDWKDVQVTLSTATPALGQDLPELTPIRLSQRQSFTRSRDQAGEDVIELSSFSVSQDKDVGYATSNVIAGSRLRTELRDVAASISVITDEFLGALSTNDMVSATFELPYSVSVQSENSPQTVQIAKLEIPVEIYHWAIPKVDETAYLKARGLNLAAFPLLAGKTQIFLDGRFVGGSQIKNLAPGEELNVILGPSPRVKIDYKLIDDLTEEVGFGGKTIRRTYRYQFEIENFSQEATQLIVRDQIPLSTHEDIQVKLLTPTPANAELDEDGILIWRLNLPPGEKLTLPFSYQIEHPTAWQLSHN